MHSVRVANVAARCVADHYHVWIRPRPRPRSLQESERVVTVLGAVHGLVVHVTVVSCAWWNGCGEWVQLRNTRTPAIELIICIHHANQNVHNLSFSDGDEYQNAIKMNMSELMMLVVMILSTMSVTKQHRREDLHSWNKKSLCARSTVAAH